MSDVTIAIDEDGTALELLIDDGADIALATNLIMEFRTPRENLIQKTAVFSDDGTDGLIRYVITDEGIPSSAGVWKVRGRYDLGGEKITTWATFLVTE